MTGSDAYKELVTAEEVPEGLVALPAEAFRAARDAYYQLCNHILVGPDERTYCTASPDVMQRFNALFNPIRSS